MRIILLSGGSGKRLWPLSSDVRAKQFLKVLKNKEDHLESMVQRVWGQLENAGLQEVTSIVTSQSQADMIRSQIGTSVPLIIEPDRKDTFPAIALSCVYLYDSMNIDLEEVITILPVDPYVNDDYFLSLKSLEKLITRSQPELALMGVKPTYPAQKYGYIIPNSVQDKVINVSHFVEKPTEENAEQLIKNGALWNCGVFAFKLGHIIKLLEEQGFPTTFNNMIDEYEKLPKISFDYAVVEKSHNIKAIAYEGEWKDLGTWNTITEEIAENIVGKGKISNDSINSHLINELDIPIMLLGLSNTVVAASPDGILVSEKSASPRLKEMIGDFDQRPMYEERRWGWYRVLDYIKQEDGNEVLTKRLCLLEGKNLSYQLHHHRSEVWTIISGIGEFILDDVLQTVKPGDVLQIPVGVKHGLKAITDIEIIEVQMGSQLIEEDIIRFSLDWNEILTQVISVERSL
ncbi:sugar phosphate nucleotidyltransferase [Bacillus salitolerans]|uniref:Sugar phosphate nucleotidyltransferase n=1 Tax=Bacillus salitolerans TaxID=1437434 RepID=A0ABW4LNY4_9BACI